jgi:Fe-S-cluster containining protein
MPGRPIPSTWITDITHFLDASGTIPDELSGPARNLAEHFGTIVAAMTRLPRGVPNASGVKCRRRPNRRPCGGEIVGLLDPDTLGIEWECPLCGDNGVISGWRGSMWDGSLARGAGAAGTPGIQDGMTIETDVDRVKKLAASREDENWQFRIFLKGIDLSPEELDAIVHRHYEAVSRQIDCCACGNCCKEALPRLSADDIRRLATQLAVSEKEIVARYLEQEKDGERHTFKRARCPFLAEKRCTVYDARPADCRSYPHLQKEEFVFRLMQAVQNCSVCPIVFNVFEVLKDELWKGREEPPLDW